MGPIPQAPNLKLVLGPFQLLDPVLGVGMWSQLQVGGHARESEAGQPSPPLLGCPLAISVRCLHVEAVAAKRVG